MSYSFYATKNLACGEGGALVTDDDEIAAKAQVLSCHGMSAGAWNRYGKEGSWRYDIEEPGYKYNMFDIQAALALTQLGRMPDMQRRRFEAVDVYERGVCGCAGASPAKDAGLLPPQPPSVCAAHRSGAPDDLPRSVHRGAEGAQRRRERAFHRAAHDERLPRSALATSRRIIPKAYAFSESEISLPLYSTLGVKNAEYVADAVLDVVKKYRTIIKHHKESLPKRKRALFCHIGWINGADST